MQQAEAGASMAIETECMQPERKAGNTNNTAMREFLTDAVQLMLVLHYALTSNGPLLSKLGAIDY